MPHLPVGHFSFVSPILAEAIYDVPMIELGIVVLIIGIIIWGVGAIIPNARILVAGKVVSLVGGILLAVGLVILLIDALQGGHGIDVHSMRTLVNL